MTAVVWPYYVRNQNHTTIDGRLDGRAMGRTDDEFQQYYQ